MTILVKKKAIVFHHWQLGDNMYHDIYSLQLANNRYQVTLS
jgi:hypothetical protein